MLEMRQLKLITVPNMVSISGLSAKLEILLHTYVKSSPLSGNSNSPGSGGAVHGWNTKPWSFEPSRRIMSSLLERVRVEIGSRALDAVSPDGIFGHQALDPLICSARVRSSWIFTFSFCLSLDVLAS